MKHLFNKIAVGGTFDYFHKGHRALIDFAFAQSNSVTIGISSDNFAKGKNVTNSFEDRRVKVFEYLRKQDYLKRSKIEKLDDVFGPTVNDPTFEAIVVTENSAGGAILINNERKKKGVKPLKVLKFNLIRAGDGSVISSTLIRNGGMDDDGVCFFSYLINKTYYLPESLRDNLSKPQGEFYKSIGEFRKKYAKGEIVSVGDETTRKLLSSGVNVHLGIIDFKINRKILFTNLSELGLSGVKSVTVDNGAGRIEKGLSRAIFDFFGSNLGNFVIRVKGEEDLAVIPVVLLSPIGTMVVYGQPGQGVIALKVTLELKNKMFELLKKFRVKN